MAKTIVGLEVTEESVRAAELSLGRRPQLIAYGEVPLPPDAARDSEVLDSGAVAVALRQLWTGARFKSKTPCSASPAAASWCVSTPLRPCGPTCFARRCRTRCRTCCRCRRARPCSTSSHSAKRAIRSRVCSSQPCRRTSSRSSPPSRRSRCERRPSTSPRSGSRGSPRRSPSPDETVATINIGDHTTQVVISQAGVPRFVRILPIDVETAAARRHTATDAVEPALELAVAAGATRTRGAMRAATSSGASDLAARLRSTLAFFASRPGASAPSKRLRHRRRCGRRRRHPRADGGDRHPLTVVSVADVVGMSGPPPAAEVALNLVGTVGIALGEVRR